MSEVKIISKSKCQCCGKELEIDNIESYCSDECRIKHEESIRKTLKKIEEMIFLKSNN